MFTRSGSGKCEEATEFWMSVFRDSKRGKLSKYPGDENNVMFTDFTLEKQWFAAMDGGETHEFQFNEAVSLVIRCKDQEEIDYYFERLSAVPQAEQCGWLQDKFGVSWQVTPFEMDEMLQKGDAQQVDRVTKAFLGMKKFDLAALRKAYQDS
jgi:predicted 3-demethylubiquinone-9 3-methyltransferase (glyoxalase superfamily)